MIVFYNHFQILSYTLVYLLMYIIIFWDIRIDRIKNIDSAPVAQHRNYPVVIGQVSLWFVRVKMCSRHQFKNYLSTFRHVYLHKLFKTFFSKLNIRVVHVLQCQISQRHVLLYLYSSRRNNIATYVY